MQNSIREELGTNFIEYAVAVNTDRAIPDSKSGLKPVAKRILWSAFEKGRLYNKPHVKAARIVGDVMGEYHPHGDSSIYGAMVRLAQPWVMRYPLIDWHGSCGNQDGDGAAAMRYTEARLAKISEDGMLAGIKKRNVDFIPNYDEEKEEPITLPAIFPNLLCNPNSGIGVAMACDWLPHNLNEVAEAIFDYMNGKEPMLPGPDFPTGGIIINKNDIPKIMQTGRGSVKVRGKYKIEKDKIVFYEIPYGVSTEKVLSDIGKACDEKVIEGIKEVRNESNKEGLRLVITCNKGVNQEGIVKKLFAKTSLQTSVSYGQVALVDKTPTLLNLKDCIKIYIDHNIDCLIKEMNFDLDKAKHRLHIVEGLLIALEDIDNVIALIKKSESSSAACTALMAAYKITEVQAKSILSMRLSSLAKLEKVELENEKKELVDKISDIQDVLTNQARQMSMIKDRLSNIVKKYGDARRTELAQIEVPKEEKEIEEVIPEDVVITVTQSGLVKRVPKASYRTQRRNGKGVKTADDAILTTISTNTTDNLMIFTDKGKMYKLLVDNIPAATNAGKGVAITNFIKANINEKIVAVTSLHRKTDAEYVVFFTKNGLVKKTLLSEYTGVKRSTGIVAIKIKDGDSIANVTFLKDEDIVLITKNGMSIHIESKTINAIGRATSGVKGIKLTEGDEVIIGLPIHKNTDKIGIFTEKGNGKRVDLKEIPCQGKGGKGVAIYKFEDNVIGAAMLDESDNLLLIGRPNSICISAKDIPEVSRTSQGNIMIKNSKLNNIVKL